MILTVIGLNMRFSSEPVKIAGQFVLPVLISMAAMFLSGGLTPMQAQTKAAKAAPNAAKLPAASTVVLGDKLATVKLAPEFMFVDKDDAKAFLQKQGSSGDGVLGIIAPAQESADDYFVVCRFEDVGYVSDDDADKLNADEILNSYKDGVKEQNEERKELKLPPIYIGGWAEKPHYDKALHHVIWALEVKDEDTKEAPVVTLNYNTRILGRRGVLSMNLVADPKNIDQDKLKVAQLLKDTTFNHGQTYAEYVPGTDKAAGYGIAGLVLGGGAMAAAAKMGFLGAIWKWILGIILVLKKFLIIALVGIGGLLSKLFGKKGIKSPPAK